MSEPTPTKDEETTVTGEDVRKGVAFLEWLSDLAKTIEENPELLATATPEERELIKNIIEVKDLWTDIVRKMAKHSVFFRKVLEDRRWREYLRWKAKGKLSEPETDYKRWRMKQIEKALEEL